MSEAECVSADWRTIGFEDGAQGVGPSRVSRYRSACAGYGVAPDLDAYNAGRRIGLAEFCRPERGYRLGRAGKAYSGACPSEFEPRFLSRYRDGRRVHQAASKLADANRRLHALDQQLNGLDEDEQSAKLELLEEGLSPLERAQLLAEILDLVNRRQEIERERSDAQARSDQLEREFDAVEREADRSELHERTR